MARQNEMKIVISAVDRASGQIGAVNRNFGGMAGNVIGKAALMTAALAATAGAMKKALAASIELNRGLANVQTLIPGNTARIKELKVAVQNMSIGVNKSTTDLTEGLYQVISAFGDTADSVKVLELAARAATAGVATTRDSINLIISATKAYGDTSAEAAAKVADLAFMTVKIGVTTFPELASSMGRVMPIAAALGVEMDELFGHYAALTGTTGDAIIVTTQLAGAMNAFLKPSEAMKKAVRELGFANAQALISEKGLHNAIRLVIGTTNESAESIAQLFQNRRALPLVFQLAGDSADEAAKKIARMSDAVGKANEAFEQQAEGINKLGFQFGQLNKENTVVWQRYGDALGVLLRYTKAIDEHVNVVKRLMGLYKDQSKALERTPEEIKLMETAVANLRAEYIELTGIKWEFPEALRGYANEAEYLKAAIASIKEEQKALKKASKDSAAAQVAHLEKVGVRMQQATREIEELKAGWYIDPRSFDDINADIGTMISLSGTLGDGWQAINERIEGSKKLFENIITTLETVPELINPIAERMEDVSGEFTMSFEEMATYGTNALGDMVSSSLRNLDNLEENFHQMAIGIISDIAAMITKWLIWKAITTVFGIGIPMTGGGQIVTPVPAQRGLEVMGGQYGKDTVPAVLSKGELVVDSDTTTRLKEFLNNPEARGGSTININPLFLAGSKMEAHVIAEYLKDKRDHFEPYVVKGNL